MVIIASPDRLSDVQQERLRSWLEESLAASPEWAGNIEMVGQDVLLRSHGGVDHDDAFARVLAEVAGWVVGVPFVVLQLLPTSASACNRLDAPVPEGPARSLSAGVASGHSEERDRPVGEHFTRIMAIDDDSEREEAIQQHLKTKVDEETRMLVGALDDIASGAVADEINELYAEVILAIANSCADPASIIAVANDALAQRSLPTFEE